MLAGAFLAVAAVVLAVALDWRPGTTPASTVDPSPLARQMTEWKRKAGEVERSRTVESEKILAALDYDNAAELQLLLNAQASTDLRDYLGRLDELEGELTVLAHLHRDRTKRLEELRSGTAVACSSSRCGDGSAASTVSAK